jgi:hypothetical protein
MSPRLSGMLKASSLAAVSISLAVAAWTINSDLHDWREISFDLSRAVASIDGESTEATRGHMADLDSRLRLFQSRWHLLPTDSKKRIDAANGGLELFHKADQVKLTDDLLFLDKSYGLLHKLPSEITVFIARKCFNGNIMEIAAFVDEWRKHKDMDSASMANQEDVKAAYIAVAKNKFLLALSGREQGPGWVRPPFPVYDAKKEDKTCEK